ncbi:UDP-glucuronate 4-epimerase 2 [Linum grandiflorum]
MCSDSSAIANLSQISSSTSSIHSNAVLQIPPLFWVDWSSRYGGEEHRQQRSEERESAIESVQLGEYFASACGKLVSILEKLLKVMAMPANGDVLFTHANISQAQRDFGYKPSTDLQTGLKKFVKWHPSGVAKSSL